MSLLLDIPEEDVRRADTQDMLSAVLGLPGQLEAAHATAQAAQVSLPREARNVVLVGMGGSAIAGDLLAHLIEREGKVPAVVARGYELPKWAGPDTLVLAASYSGNTEETLAAFVEAKRRGCMLAAASGGGKLELYAQKSSAAFLRMEPGMQPRAALGRSLAPQARILDAAGILSLGPDIQEATRVLEKMAPELGPDEPASRNEAKRLALAVQGSVPATYGSGLLAPVARRYSNQFNENAKIVSLWGVMPEMNHNELVGWVGDEDASRFTAILLRYPREHAQDAERFEFTARQIQARGGQVVQVLARADDGLPAILSTLFVGDAASVYLAAARGVDPSPVAVIDALKAHVGSTGFAQRLDGRI